MGCRFKTGRPQVTKDHRKSKRNMYASTQATEKRKLEVQISNFRLRTNNSGASRLVSEPLPLGCLSILRQKENGPLDQERSRRAEAERIPAVADNATHMRAGLRSRTFEPTEA